MHRRFHATGQGFPELIAGAHQPLAMLGAGFIGIHAVSDMACST
jgi:hypothetical protein